MDDLAAGLASLARKIGLDGHAVEDAPEAAVREFTAAVLEELAARGLIAGQVELDCWAQPRSPLS
ncbi:hypothetical protein HNQ07_003280 [Deinococcus metalli]|uniref:Uncharacterized protein n=1 Tax=Deinococcus metalli TaxID=1141878 RepID=A0A7W8NRD0_9DEIO|nr:hypothetical protein [Deinococcus metalli]MBB5377780.1 hypothetical protein [Deinococcus metalli]GHF55987.1 hypothetical protein GCM10017781_35550 [Deinococcus metalli]